PVRHPSLRPRGGPTRPCALLTPAPPAPRYASGNPWCERTRDRYRDGASEYRWRPPTANSLSRDCICSPADRSALPTPAVAPRRPRRSQHLFPKDEWFLLCRLAVPTLHRRSPPAE